MLVLRWPFLRVLRVPAVVLLAVGGALALALGVVALTMVHPPPSRTAPPSRSTAEAEPATGAVPAAPPSPRGGPLPPGELAVRDGSGNVRLVRTDGSSRPICRVYWDDPVLAWSPDGEYLAANATDSVGPPTGRERFELRILAVGPTTVRVVSKPRVRAHEIEWGPKSHRLAVVVPDSEIREDELWVVDIRGGRRFILRGAIAECVSWSPRGDRIALADSSDLRVVTVPPAGSRRRPAERPIRLPYPTDRVRQGLETSPLWLSDGTHLVCQAGWCSTVRATWIVDTDSGRWEALFVPEGELLEYAARAMGRTWLVTAGGWVRVAEADGDEWARMDGPARATAWPHDWRRVTHGKARLAFEYAKSSLRHDQNASSWCPGMDGERWSPRADMVARWEYEDRPLGWTAHLRVATADGNRSRVLASFAFPRDPWAPTVGFLWRPGH